MTKKTLISAAMVLAVFAAGTSAGFIVRDLMLPAALTITVPDRLPIKNAALNRTDFTAYWQVWMLVKTLHIKEVSDKTMIEGSIRGLVAELKDKHSVYLSPKEVKEYQEHHNPTFCGIGVVARLDKQGRGIVLGRIMENSPAAKAGLIDDDLVTEVNGKSIAGITLDKSVALIRGPKGSSVRLTVVRAGLAEPKVFTVIRSRITVKQVEFKMIKQNGRRLAYVKFREFDFRALAEFMLAIQKMKLNRAQAVILDLRGNPGGNLAVALQLNSAWIGQKTVTQVQGRDGKFRQLAGLELEGLTGQLAGLPTVLLINGDSASASEMTAGCLKDHGAATLIGQLSYGKGSVQTVRPLSDGGMLRLTIEHFLTPQRKKIDGVGVAPHIKVKMTKDDREAKRDPQLDKAIEKLAGPAPAKGK